MVNMNTNKKLLLKGLTNLAGSLPLLFLGPIVIYSSFNNNKHSLYYLVLSLGIIICILAMFLIYRGIKIIMKSLFHDS